VRNINALEMHRQQEKRRNVNRRKEKAQIRKKLNETEKQKRWGGELENEKGQRRKRFF
jgi:hypothetical protein